MTQFFQASVTLASAAGVEVAIQSDCHSSEHFAIRALVREVATARAIPFLEAVELVRGKVRVITL